MARLLALNAETGSSSPEVSSNGLAESADDRMDIDSVDERMSIVQSDYGAHRPLKVEMSNDRAASRMSIYQDDGESALGGAVLHPSQVLRSQQVFADVHQRLLSAMTAWDEAHPVKIRESFSEEDTYIRVGDTEYDDVVFGRRPEDEGQGYVKGAFGLNNHLEVITIKRSGRVQFATFVGELYDWGEDDKDLYFAVDGLLYCGSANFQYPKTVDGWDQVLVGDAFDLRRLSPDDVLTALPR